MILYAFGREVLALVSGEPLRWAGVSMARFEAARTVLAEHGGWVIFASTMSPLSTKWMSIASGVAEVPWPEFVGMLTLGIVGLGTIGKKVARLAQAFGMRVIY